jgi:sugar phosphate isomerase/epimerase
MDPPLPKEKDGTPARENWSHSYRPLPYAGGYLPVADVTRAVLQTGFRGWFSMEVFLEADQAKDDPSVPQRWARGGREAHEKMVKEILEFEQVSV